VKIPVYTPIPTWKSLFRWKEIDDNWGYGYCLDCYFKRYTRDGAWGGILDRLSTHGRFKQFDDLEWI